MNCARFEERVLQLLDRREDIAAASDLVPHASVCRRCERTRQIGMVLGTHPCGLRSEESVEALAVPTGFTDRVIAAWRQESRSTTESVVIASAGEVSSCLLEPRDAAGAADVIPVAELAAWHQTQGAPETGRGRRRSSASWWASISMAVVMTGLWWSWGGSRSPERIESLVAERATARVDSAFAMVEVDRWAPVLNTLGDESMAVVRPLTRSLHLAYDLLKHHLLGGDGIEKIDARRIESDVYWS